MPCTWTHRIDGESVIPLAPGAPTDLHRAWHSDVFEAVRRTIAGGDYTYCKLSECPELKGAQEYLLTLEQLRADFPQIARYVSGETPRFEGGPENLNIQYDATCNLACPSCNRLDLPRYAPSTLRAFSQSITQLGTDLEYIYLAGMGDPFGSPHYHEWLCTVDVDRFPKLRAITLNTNGLRWTEAAWRRIPERTRRFIKSVIVSVDGVSAETIERNRYPAKFADLMDRLRYIASLRRAGELERVRVYFVYQANNFHEMPQMVALCRALGLDSVFFARITNWHRPKEGFAALDVGSSDHPRHSEFVAIARETEKLGDERLEVVMMRP
jgi:MoaA/NifB/PqqE/SkfB family radical SAM enzyme